MNYGEISFQRFIELSDLYVTDIEKHADLCRQYPDFTTRYVQQIEEMIRSNEFSICHDIETAKKRMWRLIQEKIRKEK